MHYAEEGNLPSPTVLTAEQEELVLAAEYVYFVDGKVPTIGELAGITNYDSDFILDNYMAILPALELRSIPTKDFKLRIIPAKQIAFLTCVFNPLDLRSASNILADLDISRNEFLAWQRDPRFQQAQNKLAGEFFEAVGPYIDAAVAKGAMAGNVAKMKLYYEKRSESQLDPKILVHKMFEVVQKYVPDESDQRAIAQEVLYGLDHPRAITSASE